MSPDEAQAIALLYSEGATPTTEIRKRYGIGESSLYRVLQRHGIALRGRTGSSPVPGRSSPQTGEPPRSAVSQRLLRVVDSPITSAKSTRRRVQRTTSARDTDSAERETSRRSNGTGQQEFRVQFVAESVFEATDVREALRQAESLGAVEITAIVRRE